MWRLLAVAAVAAALAPVSGIAAAAELEPKDHCFALLGFEGDGGPVFVIVEEKPAKDGVFVAAADGVAP